MLAANRADPPLLMRFLRYDTQRFRLASQSLNLLSVLGSAAVEICLQFSGCPIFPALRCEGLGKSHAGVGKLLRDALQVLQGLGDVLVLLQQGQTKHVPRPGV
jgi:hypothetical protein